jgi:hypothetical protein
MHHRVLCIGGSITAGSGATNQAHAWPALLGRTHSTILRYKNAVGPSHFLHCKNSHFNYNISAIVIDLAPNIWDKFEFVAMTKLVAIATGTRVPVGLVGWAGATVLQYMSQLPNATVLRINTSKHFYASDGVHPNNKGHLLIAKEVNTFLHFKPEYSMINTKSEDTEICIPDARRLPYVKNVDSRWELINQGHPPIEKWGWVGDEQSGALTIDVTSVTKQLDRPSYIAHLEYLRSPNPSDLMLSCINCECTSIRGYWSWKETPFPLIHTAIRHNLRVTDSTSFSIIHKEPCQLVIQSTNRSRIDGFYIRTPYESDIYNARMGNAAQKRFSNSFH